MKKNAVIYGKDQVDERHNQNGGPHTMQVNISMEKWQEIDDLLDGENNGEAAGNATAASGQQDRQPGPSRRVCNGGKTQSHLTEQQQHRDSALFTTTTTPSEDRSWYGESQPLNTY